MHWDWFDPIWTSLIQFGQVLSNWDKSDPIWTGLIQFGQVLLQMLEEAPVSKKIFTGHHNVQEAICKTLEENFLAWAAKYSYGGKSPMLYLQVELPLNVLLD